MTGYILDTSAIIELFSGSAIGRVVFNYLISSNPTPMVPSIILGEMRKKYIENGRSDDSFNDNVALLHRWCEIQNIDEETSIRAGEIRAHSEKKGISLIDCIQLALSERYRYQVVSTDGHFEGDDRAVYIPRGDG